MTHTEIESIMSRAGNLDFSEMDFEDQLRYLAAATQFAKNIKPLVDKYAAPERTSAYASNVLADILQRIANEGIRDEDD